MAGAWFESVAVAQRRAKRRLPKSVYSALIAGSEAGVTLADNLAAFGELGFAPHVADLPPARDMTTTVMGQTISLPVLISPTGVQSVHPDGEIAVARAAAARGTAIGLSSFASKPVEEVVAANAQTFFQIYWCGSREQIAARVERARAAGAVGMIVTLDWTFSHRRDWGSPWIPDQVDLKAMIRLAPEASATPVVARVGRAGGPPGPDRPEPDRARRAAADVLRGVRPVDADPARRPGRTCAGCASSGRGRSCSRESRRVDDARRAVDAGFTAISVSNHGGNNLDSTPGVDPGPSGDRRRRRRSDRGPARRRRPPRERRRQGARARRPRGDDRPRLPVGARGRRPGRSRERARHHAQRHRLGAARARPREHCGADPATTSSSRPDSRAGSASVTSPAGAISGLRLPG